MAATSLDLTRPGMAIRHQGGSSYLEIDISHMDAQGISRLQAALVQFLGIQEKPPARPRWKTQGAPQKAAQGPGTQRSRKPKKARQKAPEAQQ